MKISSEAKYLDAVVRAVYRTGRRGDQFGARREVYELGGIALNTEDPHIREAALTVLWWSWKENKAYDARIASLRIIDDVAERRAS